MVVIPLQSVTYREGAVPRPDMVNVLEAGASKENAKSPSPTGDAGGLELETKLSVQAWVRNVDPAKHTWLDLHVFDENDQLVRSETMALDYLKAAGDDGDIYAFEGSVHRGTGAVGGSAWFGPDVRKLQYRLYYEVNGTVFSDGLLRQHELASDGDVINPPAARRPATRGPNATAPSTRRTAPSPSSKVTPEKKPASAKAAPEKKAGSAKTGSAKSGDANPSRRPR